MSGVIPTVVVVNYLQEQIDHSLDPGLRVVLRNERPIRPLVDRIKLKEPLILDFVPEHTSVNKTFLSKVLCPHWLTSFSPSFIIVYRHNKS